MYKPQRSLEGNKPSRVPPISIVGAVPPEWIPFTALLADHRRFSVEAAQMSSLTNPTGGGSTNWDGGETYGDGPFEDDEK